jgi:uncharacterized protein
MIVVIDTNCLMVSIGRASKTRWLFDALLSGVFQIAVTTDILQEYQEMIDDFYDTPGIGQNIATMLTERSTTLLVSPTYFWGLISADPDDNKFVDCAVACGADYLVTEDGHFK